MSDELLAERLRPLTFLIGTWRGEGVGGHPGIESFPFTQEIEFRVHGEEWLRYSSRLRPVAGELSDIALGNETGFWRPGEPGELEVSIAHASGVLELGVGSLAGARIELSSDVVVHGASAPEVTALHRLYGIVAGKLMYAVDMAAAGQPLSPHLSAELERVPGTGWTG